MARYTHFPKSVQPTAPAPEESDRRNFLGLSFPFWKDFLEFTKVAVATEHPVVVSLSLLPWSRRRAEPTSTSAPVNGLSSQFHFKVQY